MAEQIRGKAVIQELTPGRNASRVALVDGGVVIRVAQPDDALAATWVERAKTARGVQHPSLARMRGAMAANPGTGEPPFVAHEYVDGPLLSDVAPGLTGQEASEISRSLADGVKALHDAGLAHGRVYPRQVRLRSDQTPVLLDLAATFGAEPTKQADVAGLVKLALDLPAGPDTPVWERFFGQMPTIDEIVNALDEQPAPPEALAPAVAPAPRTAPALLEPPVFEPAPLAPPVRPAVAEPVQQERVSEPQPTAELAPPPAFEPAPVAFNPYEDVAFSQEPTFEPFAPTEPPFIPADDEDGPVPILKYDPAVGVTVGVSGEFPPLVADDVPGVPAMLSPFVQVDDDAPVEHAQKEDTAAALSAPDFTAPAFTVPDFTEPAFGAPTFQDAEFVAPPFVPVDEPVPLTAPEIPSFDTPAFPPVAAVEDTAPVAHVDELTPTEEPAPPAEVDHANVTAGAQVANALEEANRTITILAGRLAAAQASTTSEEDQARYEAVNAELESVRASRADLAGQVDDLTTRLTSALEETATARTALDASDELARTLQEQIDQLNGQISTLQTQIGELSNDLADAAAAHARATAAEHAAQAAADEAASALEAAATARADLSTARAEAAAAVGQVVPLTAQVADLTARLAEANRARDAAEDAKAQFIAERALSVRQSLSAVERSGELEAQIARLTTEVETLKASARSTHERADAAVRAAQARADTAIAAAEARAEAATAEATALRRLTAEMSTNRYARPGAPATSKADHTERESLRTQVADLTSQNTVAAGEIAELRRQLATAQAAVTAAQAGAAFTTGGLSLREQALQQEVNHLTDQVHTLAGDRNMLSEQLRLLQETPNGAGDSSVERLQGEVADLRRELEHAHALYQDAESRYSDLAIAHASVSERLQQIEAQHPSQDGPTVALPPVAEPLPGPARTPHPIVPTTVLPSEAMGAPVVPGSAHSFATGSGPALVQVLRQLDGPTRGA